MLSMPCPARPAISSTLSKPRATLAVLPPPDGSPTCRSRREESLRALAVTCGRTMEEAEHRHCSAGRILVPPGRAPDQPPEKSSPLVPASAGRQPGWGWKRACGGPSCGYGEGRGVQASPWRSRIVNARPSPCRRMPQADFSRPCPGGGKRYALPVGCGHHPARLGPARGLRHPTHSIFRTAQPARGPPETLPALISRRSAARVRCLMRPCRETANLRHSCRVTFPP